MSRSKQTSKGRGRSCRLEARRSRAPEVVDNHSMSDWSDKQTDDPLVAAGTMCSSVFFVEDIESRQADVRDFLLSEDYRSGVLRRTI
jgi:hypothetical protein